MNRDWVDKDFYQVLGVGKARGLACAMKGGFGFASLSSPGGPTVAAAVAVNAFGDVRDPFDPAAAPGPGGLLAACRESPGSPRLVGAEATLAALPAETPHPWEGNTTLAVVMTDAVLSKAAALKVCQMAFACCCGRSPTESRAIGTTQPNPSGFIARSSRSKVGANRSFSGGGGGAAA